MIDQITAQVIAEAQAKRPDSFTLNDAADIIINKAQFNTDMGVPTDSYDLAVATTALLGLPGEQKLGIIQSVLRRRAEDA